MDFEFLPPEINSGRIYSGPGSGPLLAAATSWDCLAAELDTTAQAYQHTLHTLTSLHWHGPTAAAMTARTTPYIDWLHTTAEQTRLTAQQTRTAAAAYELAHALSIPPAAVAANRATLAALVATNFFGQNTPAIAATEAQYAEYWAQDAAAMSTYAATATAATQLTPFTNPEPTANLAAFSAQSTAVTQAITNTAAANTPLQSALAALQTTLALPTSPMSLDLSLDILILIWLTGVAINGPARIQAIACGIIRTESDLGILPDLGVAEAVAAPPRLAASISGGPGLGPVTATLSRAGAIGSMSVPAGWTQTSGGPAGALVKGILPQLTEAAEPNLGSALSGMPGVPGARGSRPTIVVPRYGERIVSVMSRPPAAG